MATWRVSFTDPADRYIAEQYDAKDASYWQDTLRTRAKPGVGMPGGLQALVEHLAPEYGVDPAFASAIAQTESNYQPGVVSSAGAKGVMQLMDATGQRFGVRDPFDPEQNIRGGLAYLRVLQDLFPGRRDLQMAAYNAGEGAVKKYGNTIPPYPETQDYVRKVSSRLARTTPQGVMMQAQVAPGQPQAPPRDPATTLPMDQEFLTPPAGPTMPDVTGAASTETPPQAGGEAMPEVWMPAPKPIEKAYKRGGIFGTLNAVGASIGIGLTGAAASILEAPTTGLRMAGLVEEEGESPLEKAAAYLRTTIIPRAREAQEGQPPLLTQIGEGIGAGMALFVPGMGIERGIAAVVTNAPKIAALLGATTSGVLQGTVAMNDTYRALTPLVGEAEAGKRAQTALLTNTVLGSVGSALGMFNPWLPSGLSRVVAGAASQGVQGGIQYDWNRRLFWVPAASEKAASLMQMGWEQQGERVVQPYRFKDQLEAVLVNTVVGGVFSAAAEYSRLPLPAALKDVADDPGFSADRALQAAMSPDTPPADIELSRWQRWGNAILDLLPEPVPGGGGLLQQALGSQRGSISPQRLAFRQQRRMVDEQLVALDRGGDDAQAVLDSLGVTDVDAAHDQLMTQRQQIVDDLAALPPEPVAPSPLATPETGTPAETPIAPADLSLNIPPTEAELAQAYQPEAVSPERFRTESGRWRTPLRDLPTQELELQDAIRQRTPDGRWGIKLTGETDILSELGPLLSATRSADQPLMAEGIQSSGLLNNRTGFTPQQMAERLAEHGFLATADTEALKLALDRSIVEGQNVYSVNATGYVPLADSPTVAAAHASVQELVRNFAGRTEEQRRGTRPHAVAISEAQAMIDAGGWTKQDVLDMLPGTIMDDTGIAQVVLTAREVTNQMVQAAQTVMETGGRDPRAVEDYLTIKSMFADIHVAVTGVAAESGRILSMWNDPMSPHKRYMDGLKDLMLQHGNETALKMARADLSLATPEEVALARQLKAEADTQFQDAAARGWLAGPDFAPMRDDWMQQQTLFPADQIAETWATVMGDEMPLAVSPDPGTPSLPEGQGPGLPYHLAQGRSPQQMRREAEGQRRAVQDFVRKMRDEAGLPSETELQQRRHAADPLSRMHDPSAEELPLFTPSELEPRLKQALGWELLTPDERRAAQEALAHFAGYYRRPGMAEPEAAAQPLMLGTEPSQAPTDVALAREAGLSPAQLRVIQANLGQAQPGKWAMVLEQWKAALLGPPTWIANAVSNTSMGIYSLPVRFFAGVASNVRQGAEALGNQLGTRDAGPIEPGVSVWETGDLLYGMTHGWMDHLRAMAQTWRTGESRIDTGPGKTDAHQKAVTAENLGLEGTTVGKVMEFWAEHLGFMSFGRDTFRVLNTADEAYLSLFYTMERQALAQAEARAQGLQGLSRAEVMSKVMSDPNVAEWIHTQAVDQAKLLTLRTDIPTEGIASALGRLAHWKIGSGDTAVPVGQLVTPFYTVPTNAAIQTIDNSPLALLSSKFYADLAAGGRKADMAMGKLITGSLTAASVASLVGAMVLTGRAPADPVQKDLFLKEHPEYSAYVPGLGIWVDYRRWLGPLGNSIAVVADTAQLMGELSGPLAERAAAAAYLSLTRNLVGQTGWRDIGDFLEILNGGRNLKNEDSSDVLKSLHRYARQKTGSVLGIPLTLGLSQSANARLLVRALDPEEKMVKGWLDQLYSTMPWGSPTVPRKVTITGEPELYGVGVGPEMLKPITRAFFPGLKAIQAPLDAASRAILDNDMQISKVSDTLLPIGVMQASADVETFRGMQSTKLTPAEHERLQVVAAMNEMQAKKLYGTTERVIPSETMRLVTESAALRAQAAADPMGGSPLLMPPQEEMSLGELWNWLTTTPAFERGSPGRGGGKEKAFQTVAQEYQKWGQELFLELEPDIGGRHAQSRIQRQIQPYAPADRESMRLTLEEAHMATRPAMRGVMGLPALSIGGP